jgi:hypothetical protein
VNDIATESTGQYVVALANNYLATWSEATTAPDYWTSIVSSSNGKYLTAAE